MPPNDAAHAHSVRLLARTFLLRTPDNHRRRPTVFEVLRQYFRTVNFFADRRRALHAAFELSFWATVPATLLFALRYATPALVLAWAAMFYALANVYNTVWYHRYCSHHAFRFARPFYARLFLWLNPFGYREEVYALNHYVHHAISDDDGDPYGPHLGWLGTLLASSFEVDIDITEAEFERLKVRLSHIGIPFASFDSFRRWACIEYIPHYLARWALAACAWAAFWLAVGGVPLLLAWMAAQFAFHYGARDFNYRGHGGSLPAPRHVDGWDFDRTSSALNQRFYGLLAGEWHNNHHAYRTSANSGFLDSQLDIPFLLIKLMARMGIVVQYNDYCRQFRRRYGLSVSDKRARPAPPTSTPTVVVEKH